VALLAGVLGGAAGGGLVVFLGASGPAGAPAPASTVTLKGTAGDAGPSSDWAALQASIDRTLPAIVTIVADLPARGAGADAVQTRNLGSGIVIDDAGHVVTNFHVVEGAETLSVVLATGEQRPARFVGDDSPFTDLAVLQVPAAGLRSVRLARSSELRIGEPVVALGGSAISSQNAATFGIVSGVRRSWPRPHVTLEDLVQTDAAINHGDSGGALMTFRGEIIGVLTTVVRETPNGLAIDGVSFAQSTDSLRDAIDGIIRNGKSRRPRLGFERFNQHVEVTPGLAAQRNLPVPAGALVTAVAANSPAAAAGVQVGDIVVGVNGVAVDLVTPFVNLLKDLGPRDRAELAVLRNGQPIRINISPALE
jgi:serine protease DegQ